MKNEYYPFINLPLEYDYNELEPYIDTKTMWLHHDRHLRTYTDNLNKALKDFPTLQKLSLEQLIKISPKLPRNIRESITNNAGGVYNHRFFFDSLGRNSNIENSPVFYDDIVSQFGSFQTFKQEFTDTALSVFGSGYAWLIKNKGRLIIIKTINQECPLSYNFIPVLCIDVWEHAYYLKHYNVRKDYINDFFNVIDYEKVFLNYTRTI